MKILLTILPIVLLGTLHAQTMCGSVPEGGTLTLTAPPGNVFTSIVFASYGTPTGSCGSFATSGCHATNSSSIVSSFLVGNNSGSIAATNGIFGDPCSGTVKLLAVEAAYAAVTPLTLTSFSLQPMADGRIRLSWHTENEVNTTYFLVERSSDGLVFETVGTVSATGNTSNDYSYSTEVINQAITYFRLKMTDSDGRFKYSNIVRSSSVMGADGLIVFPNPVKDLITISGLNGNGELEVMDLRGRILKQLYITTQFAISIDLARFSKGIYLIKYKTSSGVLSRKILKQ